MKRSERVVAVTGIDGCGKSSVIRRFAELWPNARRDTLALTCPTYHETPNAPFARLSERLHRFSRAADALGSFELKGAALYLQMTLHGPVERCLLEAYRPVFLLTEHHSVVDTLAYGAIYRMLIRKHADATLEAPLRERLDSRAPGSYDEIVQWAALHAEYAGTPASIFELGLAVARMLDQPRASLVDELTRRYGTGLPDVLLLLDLPAETAIERLRARGDAQGELHEQAPMLEKLRRLYLDEAACLKREHPGTETFVIDAVSSGSIDETLREVMKRAGIGDAATIHASTSDQC
jgi:thymidylate kinase